MTGVEADEIRRSDVPQNVEGVNILSHAPDQPRSIPCSGVSPDRFYLSTRTLSEFQSCAVLCGTKKAIAYMNADNFIQFDLDQDPEEMQPFQADSTMTENLLYYWASPLLGQPLPVEDISDEDIRLLNDLGYIR